MAGLAGAILLVLRLTWDADAAAVLLTNVVFGDWDSAVAFLQAVRRYGIPLGAAVFLVALVPGYLLVFRPYVMRICRSLSSGVNALLDSGHPRIELPGELADVESTLNDVRMRMERRDLEARLDEQRKNDLVMYLAHDIRTPLTSVIGYLSLLDEARDMPAAQRERYVRVALDKSRRLDRLVDEFFDITRYNLTDIALQIERVDLSVLLVQMVEEFHPQLRAHGNTVDNRMPPTCPVPADAAQIARVFNNILKNAISYGDRDSVIRIDGGIEAGAARVAISSHGRTIPPQRLAMLFDKFYRLDASRNAGTGGAGLGLAIARQIVQSHGGTIGATSERGVTTFTVVLPAEPSAEAPTEPSTGSPSTGPSGESSARSSGAPPAGSLPGPSGPHGRTARPAA